MTRILMLMLGTAALGLTACNTIEGAGEDVSNAGDVVSGTADELEPEVDDDLVQE